MERTIKFSVIVPLFDNDGVSLACEEKIVASELRRIAGGFTCLPILGEWEDETGKVFADESHLYYAYVDAGKLETLRELAPQWNELLRQQCLMVEAIEASIEFVTSRAKVLA